MEERKDTDEGIGGRVGKLKEQLGSVRGGKMNLYWKSCPPSGIAFGY